MEKFCDTNSNDNNKKMDKSGYQQQIHNGGKGAVRKNWQQHNNHHQKNNNNMIINDETATNASESPLILNLEWSGGGRVICGDDSGGGGIIESERSFNSENVEPTHGGIVYDDDQVEKVESIKSSDSTDNLSYLHENDIIEDIVLLSEDEMSNPDDCVYAYRGDAFESPDVQRHHNQHNHQQAHHNHGELGDDDDETDFLEMDFDPEPTSETDGGGGGGGCCGGDIGVSSINLGGDIVNNFFDKIPLIKPPLIPPLIPKNDESKSFNDNLSGCNGKLMADAIVTIPTKNTGTKPKKPQNKPIISAITPSIAITQTHNRNHSSLDDFDNEILINSYSHEQQQLTQSSSQYNNHSQEVCLDCTENEFLYQTNRVVGLKPTDSCQFCSKNKENKKVGKYSTSNLGTVGPGGGSSGSGTGKCNAQSRNDKIQGLGLNFNDFNIETSGKARNKKFQFSLDIQPDVMHRFDSKCYDEVRI